MLEAFTRSLIKVVTGKIVLILGFLSADPFDTFSDSRKKGDAKHNRKPKHVRPKKEEEDDLGEIMKNYRDRVSSSLSYCPS